MPAPDRDAVQLRLERWLGRHIAALAEPLVKLSEDESITGLARGVAFRLVEQLGVISRDLIADDVKALGQEERAALRKHGVRFGAFHVFIPALLKPAATPAASSAVGLSLREVGRASSRSAIPEPPGQGLTSLALRSARRRTASIASPASASAAGAVCASTCWNGSAI